MTWRPVAVTIAAAAAAQRAVAVFSPEMLGLFAQRTWQKVEGLEWEIGKKKTTKKPQHISAEPGTETPFPPKESLF